MYAAILAVMSVLFLSFAFVCDPYRSEGRKKVRKGRLRPREC